MKKVITFVLAALVLTTLAFGQATKPWTPATYGDGATGIPFNIDKLGAHQNGGRGCVGCHAPHSGARGNGGALQWDATASDWVSVPVVGDSGDEALWGQDLGPVYGQAFTFPTGAVTITATSSDRMRTGVAMCLSCHDGNFAKGAMMQNQSFEQAAGLLPLGYGTQPIPTLLGNDGGSVGNYLNDHPVGPDATLGSANHGAIAAAQGYFTITDGKVAKAATFVGSDMEKFEQNYGLPTITGARAGAGFAVDTGMTDVDLAYVVCTTCHTPHSMYTASLKGKTYPSYFFIAAPYNPGANTANGTKASSATQFCRQCHFRSAGGSNEASGISIPTAW